jgi:MFS family permease
LKTYTSSDISWIGTVQGFLLIVFGIISGPFFDQGHHRALLIVGTFLAVFGMMMTSLSSQYWQLFLAQGLCVGLGAGCLFLPSLAIVVTYFSTKRALATGIAAAGGSIGSVIYPIVFRNLQPKVGFAWATRVIGFISLSTLLVSILIMRTRIPHPKTSRALIDATAFRSGPYVLFSIALFLAFLGLYIPFFYVIVYAERSLNIDPNLSSYLLSVLNASSVFGRILPGLLADKIGALNTLTIFTLLSAVLSYVWLAVHDLGGLLTFCVMYGFLSGAVVSLPPTVVAALVPELRLIGTWMGMCFCFAGLGFLIGNPIAGTAIDVMGNKFDGGRIFAATTVLASGITLVGVRLLKFKTVKDWKM